MKIRKDGRVFYMNEEINYEEDVAVGGKSAFVGRIDFSRRE